MLLVTDRFAHSFTHAHKHVQGTALFHSLFSEPNKMQAPNKCQPPRQRRTSSYLSVRGCGAVGKGGGPGGQRWSWGLEALGTRAGECLSEERVFERDLRKGRSEFQTPGGKLSRQR